MGLSMVSQGPGQKSNANAGAAAPLALAAAVLLLAGSGYFLSQFFALQGSEVTELIGFVLAAALGLAAGFYGLRKWTAATPASGSALPAVATVKTSAENPAADWAYDAYRLSPIGTALVDRDLTVLKHNHAFSAIVGDRTVDGENIAEVFASEEEKTLPQIFNEGGNGETTGAAIATANGSSDENFAGKLFLTPLNAGGFVIHVLDVTQQRKLETQFAQSQKMLAVGKLAGGIAHDFNNLLTAINGFCDLLLMRHPPGDPSFADIMQVRQNANRAANLVRQLLAFSRQQTLQPQILSLPDVLSDLSNLLRRLIGAGIDLRLQHGPDLGTIKVDRVQLEQVLINLAVNARDAMDGQGTLNIRTSNISADEVDRFQVDPPLPPAKWVMIEIQDTGTGIPDTIIGQIFEPFFTTKPVGDGTGLGLSTVYGIVKQTGGFIYADNPASGGARFRLFLPQIAGEAQHEDGDSRISSHDLSGAGTILLVEDEDPVRLFASRALRSKGYRVLEARSGVAALALLTDADEAIDLLITDVVMPEMDGPALIEKVRERWPQMRVICVSGYAEGAFRDKLATFDDIHFIPKPFSLSQLALKVKSVLGGEDEEPVEPGGT